MHILTLLMTFAYAQTVLLPAPDVSLREYHARLRVSPEYMSAVESYVRRHPTAANRDRLLAAFAEAQVAFTERPVEEAKLRLRELVARLETDDWNANEREIFLTAFLRLAQLDPEGADGWLARALTLGPGLEYDRGLFPPPLLARLEKLRTTLPRVRVSEKLGAFSEMLVQGVSCRRERCPDFPRTREPVRVTFLSEVYAPVTVHVALEKLNAAAPETRAFVAGRCGTPEFRPPSAEFTDKAAFFGLTCGQPEVALRPLPTPVNAWPLPMPTETPKPKRAFYHSPWFWTGAVAVITTAIVLSQPRGGSAGDSSAPPTTVHEPTVTRAN